MMDLKWWIKAIKEHIKAIREEYHWDHTPMTFGETQYDDGTHMSTLGDITVNDNSFWKKATKQ